MKNAITIVATILIAVGCGDDGSERSSIAVESDNTFWKLIHNPEDQNFDDVIVALESAVEEDPEDAYSVAHLGWAHFWAFAEGTARGTVAPETAIDHMKSAETSFTTAVALAPEEPRIRGFLGYTRQALGQATQDQNVLDQSRADISASVTMWPEWALFGAAYGPDAAPHQSDPFAQAVESYWANLDVCANKQVDRENPDWTPYLEQQTLEGRDRACWDSWIAPYNLEGFFLIMADALVKSGDVATAAILYKNATLLEHYDTWPFKTLLEERIENIDINVDRFRAAVTPGQPVDPATSQIINTGISCAICHQGDADANYNRPTWIGATADQHLKPF